MGQRDSRVSLSEGARKQLGQRGGGEVGRVAGTRWGQGGPGAAQSKRDEGIRVCARKPGQLH